MTPPLPEKMIEAGAFEAARVIAYRHGHKPDDWLNDERRAEVTAAYLAMRSHPDNPDRVLVEKLVEALKAARPRLAHKHACWSCRPSTEWAEHGSASFDNCDCEIKIVDEALAAAQQGGE